MDDCCCAVVTIAKTRLVLKTSMERAGVGYVGRLLFMIVMCFCLQELERISEGGDFSSTSAVQDE